MAKPRMTVGRYEIHDTIARGGMGTVCFGRLLGAAGFGRIVAIKRMHPQLVAEPEIAAMFVDEARLASRIQHPNVVGVLDVAQEGEELFLVMEYVRGESLSALLKAQLQGRGIVPIPVAVAIVAHALHGLHAAHEAKGQDGVPLELVHRDVSPQNILVGADGLARVVDFGIAKSAQRLHTTREGEIKGKPAYMAPEQLRGAASARTDVYSAGVVLWGALAGRRFFAADSEVEVIAQALARAGGAPTDPPSAHRPGISPAIDAIVARATAVEPSQRFATAEEMAIALERTGEIASASEVAAWVSTVATDALAKRAAVVARIEASAPGVPLEDTGPRPKPRAEEPSEAPGPSITAAAEPITRVEAVRTKPVRVPGRSPVLPLIVGAILLAGAGLGLHAVRSSPATPGALPSPVPSNPVPPSRAEEPPPGTTSAIATATSSADGRTAVPPPAALDGGSPRLPSVGRDAGSPVPLGSAGAPRAHDPRKGTQPPDFL